MGITGGEDGYSWPLGIADDSGSLKNDDTRPVSCDPCMNFACACGICADFDLLPHFDLWPEDVKLEPVKLAMAIVAKGVERELMGKIK